MTDLPTFAEIAEQRLADAGKRDRTIEIKVAIGTARMMVERERAIRDDLAIALIEARRALIRMNASGHGERFTHTAEEYNDAMNSKVSGRDYLVSLSGIIRSALAKAQEKP